VSCIGDKIVGRLLLDTKGYKLIYMNSNNVAKRNTTRIPNEQLVSVDMYPGVNAALSALDPNFNRVSTGARIISLADVASPLGKEKFVRF